MSDSTYKKFWTGTLLFTILSVVAILGPLLREQPVEAQAPGWFFVIHNPAVNTQATASQAAAGAGLRNIVDCISATYVADTTAPAATTVTLNVRDGATGAGTIIWTADLSLPAVASEDASPVQLCGLGIPGTANTAMTIEFAAAGGANTFQAVSMKGRVGQ